MMFVFSNCDSDYLKMRNLLGVRKKFLPNDETIKRTIVYFVISVASSSEDIA